MINIICNDNIKLELLDDFYRYFSIMCLNGIGLFQDADYENNIQKTIDSIKKQELLVIENTNDGFNCYETNPNEIGFCILDLFDMGNSYCDSFTSDNACMEYVFKKLCEKYPNIDAESKVEFDDGISCITEHIVVENGKIVLSSWDEDDEEYEEEFDIFAYK